MRVTSDPQRCVGAGQCVRFAPEVFDQNDDDGVVVVLDTAPPTDLWGAVDEAVDGCPTKAIAALDDAAGNTTA